MPDTKYQSRASLQSAVEQLEAWNGEGDATESREIFHRFRQALDEGEIRAAERDSDGSWLVYSWVKRGIMSLFRYGHLTPVAHWDDTFFDRDTLPTRHFSFGDGVRIVPGGSTVRSGTYVAPGVVMMPPSYVNIGAYVDADTMIDSHVLVGSCAQIGKRVHLSAGVQVGGVLEPAGALPVIVEEDVFVGGGCGLFEGVLVRRGAVLAPGVNITGSTHLFDLVNERIVSRQEGGSLEIPSRAVVVPGSRPVKTDFGIRNDLQLYTPVIVKYRDENTDAATALTSELRGDG